MEAYLKLLLSVAIVFAISHLSKCLDEDPLIGRCPDSVRRECEAQGRKPCSGREYACGDCIEGYVPTNNKCEPAQGTTDQDLPGDVEDRVVAELAAGSAQKTDDKTPTQDVQGQQEAQEVMVERKEAGAAVDVQEPQPKPFTGEIVLEEWQFMLIVGGCILLAVVGVAIAFYCCYRIQTATKDAEAEYPSYGVTGPGAGMTGDRKLAQSAQMYHYQHQKQQMIAMQKREKGESAEDASDYDSEEENDEGDLTVYECPGLAPTGEMQVKNPLFSEEQYKESTPPPGEDKP